MLKPGGLLMARLTNPDHIAALAAKVATMQGTAAEIAAELNAPATTQIVRTVTTDEFLEAVSPTAYAQVLAIAKDVAKPGHAQAAWLIQALDAGQVSATEGTQGRAVLELLLSSGILSAAESQALIAAAMEEAAAGPSWATANGIGYVYPEFVEQVRN
jgi:hypothetical protein